MANQKMRWSKVYESSEEELLDYLDSRKLKHERITAEESTALHEQVSETECTIWCAEGSLKVHQDSLTASLQPGDALRLSAQKPYSLMAGLTGYVCYITS